MIKRVFYQTVTGVVALCLGLAACKKVSSPATTTTSTQTSITSFAPIHGTQGDTVTITGTGFTTGDSVYFGGGAARFITSLTATQIKAVVPANAVTGTIQIKDNGSIAATSSTPFTVDSVKTTITGFTPIHGTQGDTVTITGTGFAAGDSVYFGGDAAKTITSVTATQIKAIVPGNAVTGAIQLKRNGSVAATSSTNFTVDSVNKIIIAGFTPAHGKQGDTVTITGTGFATDDSVYFHGSLVKTIIATGSTQLTVVVPDTASTGNIQIKKGSSAATSTTDFTVDPSVYACGVDGFDACYWKNGKQVLLTGYNASNAGQAHATGIYISGNDIYLAGDEFEINTATKNIVYWKNGKAITLISSQGSPPSITYDAKSIYVANNDVYVTGNIIQTATGQGVGNYWKNGTSIPLTGTSPYVYSAAGFITGSGNDVYIAGSAASPTNGGYFATYWKNGSEVHLNGDALHFYNANYSMGNSIFLSGSDVYVAGWAFDTLSYVYAAYWKNGTATYLHDNFTNAQPLTQQNSATSIYVSGSDVYVAGYTGYDQTKAVATAAYWKNGALTKLTNGSTNTTTASIVVSGSDVYVGGSDANQPRLWKNGTPVNLPVGSSYGGYVSGVVVK